MMRSAASTVLPHCEATCGLQRHRRSGASSSGDMNQEVGMGSLTRHLVGATVASLSALLVIGPALLASRQLPPITDLVICATPVSGTGAEASFLIENSVAMRKM